MLSGTAGPAPLCQLVTGRLLDLTAVPPLRGELVNAPTDLLQRSAHGNAEHALTTLQQIDDLLRRGAFVHGGAIGEECYPRQIADAALAQMVDRDAHVVQRDSGIQQALHDLEYQQILERVQALLARPLRGADTGPDQLGPRPVVELPVADSGDLARRGTAVADKPIR